MKSPLGAEMRFAWKTACAVMLFLPSLSMAGDVPRTAYTAGNAEATRFADSDVASVDLPPGAEVEVVAEAGDKVRVRYRTSFGWVSADLLTDQAPVPADTVNLSLDGPPGFR